MNRAIPLLLLVGAGCFKAEQTSFPTTGIDFDPGNPEFIAMAATSNVTVPEDWKIDVYESELQCPDGENTNGYFVYPEGASGSTPVAIIFHSGPFDYVINPANQGPNPPTLKSSVSGGTSRLERSWAVRRAFATLGMQPDFDGREAQAGAVPIALAEQGVAMFVVANCWGDYWHNSTANPSAASENLDRRGYEAAEWAYDLVTGGQPVFPISIDANTLYGVGQAEGGRAIAELAHTGRTFDAVILDTYTDELTSYWNRPDVHGDTITGLLRIFNDDKESTNTNALFNADAGDWPARVTYVYAPKNGFLPSQSTDTFMANVPNSVNLAEIAIEESIHVPTGGDIDLARRAVEHMVTGTDPG